VIDDCDVPRCFFTFDHRQLIFAVLLRQNDPVLVDKLTMDIEQLVQQLDVERKHRQSLDLQV
jgi:hypothetical protein